MIRIDIKVNPESNQTLGVHFYMFAFIIALYAGHYCARCCKDNNFLFEKPLLPYFSLCLCFIIS